MLDAGCSILDKLSETGASPIGCWMFDVGCSMLDVGCWMLDVRCWMLDVGCWMFDVGCWMFDVGYPMLDVRYPMFEFLVQQLCSGDEFFLSTGGLLAARLRSLSP